MTRVDYRAYLRSEAWRVTRRMMLDHAEHRCQVCNGTQLLQVHHRTYARLGRERFQDLTVLCDACHAKHHDKLPKVPGASPLRVVKTPPSPLRELPAMDDVRADRAWREKQIVAHQQTCICCAGARSRLKDAA